MTEMIIRFYYFKIDGLTTERLCFRAATFLFPNDVHYIGFLKSRGDHDLFEAGREYEELFLFPSIEYVAFAKVLAKDDTCRLTLGKHVIGEGKVMLAEDKEGTY